jgi:dipeptidyl-peptidase-4
MSARVFFRAASTFFLVAVVEAGFTSFVGAGFSRPVFAQAQQPALSIDTIFNPATRVDYAGTPTTNMTWLDDTTWLQTRRGNRGVEWVKVNAATGQATPLFDAARMESALAALPGMTRDDAAQAARSGGLSFDDGHTRALATIGDDLYVYDFAANAARRLTAVPGAEEEATFSPDGRLVAFVRANNLHVVDVAAAREQALTTDGSAEILNGKLDWLYQEEIYGRGQFKGYWWSPDSARIAFLQLDERPVPEYTVVNHLPYRPDVEITDYPKAGDPNPLVKLGVARVTGGAPVWADLSSYAGDILIVDVSWHPESAQVVAQVQDREQTWLDVQMVNAETGQPRRVLRETTKAWVNNNGSPTWLKDGSFLWISERTGFRHLYRYRADGTQIRQVTSGRWDVRTFYGVSEESRRVFFAGNERGATEMHVYSAPLDQAPGTTAPGTTTPGTTRVSSTPGWHRAIFNPSFTQYVGVWNDVTTPNQVRLHRADGTEARVIDANPRPNLQALRLPTPEFLEVKARDGFVMDAMMIKPRDFNPARRYPVYQFTYAGPGAQSVKNQWGGTQYLYHQLLAEQDVIVWILDNRSASGKGVESQWPVYGRLGELELQDLEDGIAWLRQQSYVDASRIVLHGWSYGGFMTAYALTHSTSWSAGIVGAPVSDWRDYDTVYTERLMKTPQNNPDGYRRTAPRFAAANLQARMLLVHGTMDDNVHMQNSVQFAYELQKAGKPFEMMVYATQRHGFTDAQLITHLNRTMFDFVLRAVAAPGSSTGVATSSR